MKSTAFPPLIPLTYSYTPLVPFSMEDSFLFPPAWHAFHLCPGLSHLLFPRILCSYSYILSSLRPPCVCDHLLSHVVLSYCYPTARVVPFLLPPVTVFLWFSLLQEMSVLSASTSLSSDLSLAPPVSLYHLTPLS